MRKQNTEHRFQNPEVRDLLVCALCSVLCALFFAGCTKEQAAPKGEITGYDDFGRKIVLAKPPERVVALSSTPIPTIFELGAGERIVGVSDYIGRSYAEICRRYPSVLKKTKVGGFGNPSIEKIVSLNPDLIICYDSFNSPGKYTSIFEKYGLPYAAFGSCKDVSHGLEQIRWLGVLLGKEKEAKQLTRQMKTEIDKLASKIRSKAKTHPLVYFWWGSGIGTYGNQAVVNELIELSGGINLAREFDKQYMQLSFEYVLSKDPDVIIISYYQENQKEARIKEIKNHPAFAQVKAVKNNRVYAIDGNSIHSSIRFAEALRKLTEFIHPELVKERK